MIRQLKRGTRSGGLGRRGFLAATGGVAVASLLADAEAARAATAPKRLVVIYTPDGTIHEKWRPKSGGRTDFVLGDILAPFETAGLRGDLLMLDGVRRISNDPTGAHAEGMFQMLTGFANYTGVYAGGPSIDEYVNQRIGGGLPALRVSVRTTSFVGDGTRMSFGDAGNPLHPENSPYKAKNEIFAGFDPTGAGPSSAEIRRRAIQERVLGYTSSRAGKLATRLGGQDREAVTTHKKSIDELLNAPNPSMGPVCSLDVLNGWTPDIYTGTNGLYNDNFPAIAAMQFELMAAAFACDRTRVATLQFNQSVSESYFKWANADAEHHGLSHYSFGYTDPFRTTALVNIYTWYATQIAKFAADLKARGLLDNTVILWTTEMGKGHLHSDYDIPMVIIGGANHFKTGEYVDFRGTEGKYVPGKTGVSHSDVLTSVCNAVGVETTSFGDPARCFGPLKGVTL